jgi:hypothetical protein
MVTGPCFRRDSSSQLALFDVQLSAVLAPRPNPITNLQSQITSHLFPCA